MHGLVVIEGMTLSGHPGIIHEIIFLPCPPNFEPSSSFWTGSNHFGQDQIRFFWTKFYYLDLSKNELFLSKMIWIYIRTRHWCCMSFDEIIDGILSRKPSIIKMFL